MDQLRPFADRPLVGIVTNNSVDYVRRARTAMSDGAVLVPLRMPGDPTRRRVLSLSTEVVPSQGGGWLSSLGEFPRGSDVTMVAFSSGTEGQPKAILLTCDNLGDVVDRLNESMALDGEAREYVGVPVSHSFGFGRCRSVLTAGGHVFIPDHGFNPAEFAGMLRRGDINALSLVPTLCRLLLEHADLIGNAGRRLRWMEIGSQSMSRQEKERIRALFPNAVIVQHYGLTEASRSTLLHIERSEGGNLESVGMPTGDVKLRIEEDGRIAIKGPHVAPLIKVDDRFVDVGTTDGWLVTKDLGELADGHLHYRGRSDDLINIGGIKVPPESMERRMRVHLKNLQGFAIAKVPSPLLGERVAVAVLRSAAPERDHIVRAAHEALIEFGVTSDASMICVDVDSLPFTDNGKLRRAELSQTIERSIVPTDQLADTSQSHGKTDTDPVEAVRSIFARRLQSESVNPEDSFITLGGDSLKYIELSVALERQFGELPRNWHELTVKNLGERFATGVVGSSTRITLDSTVVIRAIAPVLVVANHSGIGWLAGGAALLLAVAGMNFGKFQWPHLLRSKFGTVATGVIANVLLPYWLILAAYQVLKQDLVLPDLLLYGNFVGQNTRAPFNAWFIQVVIQMLVIFSMLCWIRPLRSWARDHTFTFCAALLTIACGIRGIEPTLFPTMMENLGRELSWVAWLFVLGFIISMTESFRQRVVVSMCALFLPAAFYFGDVSRTILTSAGCLVMIWSSRLPVPSWLARIATPIGSASMFIYMLHSAAPVNSPTSSWPVDLIRIVVGVLLGLAGWWLYNEALRRALAVLRAGQASLRGVGGHRPSS